MATGTLNFKPEAQSDRTIRTLPGPGGPAGPVSPFGPGGPAGPVSPCGPFLQPANPASNANASTMWDARLLQSPENGNPEKIELNWLLQGRFGDAPDAAKYGRGACGVTLNLFGVGRGTPDPKSMKR
jgi:hypothetical protein